MDENLDKKQDELDTELTTFDDIDDKNEDIKDESQDDDFEFDEDGNIIIPDVDDENDKEEDEATEESQDEKKDEEENEGLDKSDEVVEPDKKPDDRDEKIAKLEARLKNLESQGKETLSKLGIESEDILEGLEKMAAEADDVTLEEYRKTKATTQRNNDALKMLQAVEFEKKMAADLAEVQAAYPETKKYAKMTEIDNFAKFGQFRDLGLSPKEAYAAANPDSVRQNVANAVKQKSLNNKEHLQSAVPKGSKDNAVTMTKQELSTWRELFPNKSDKEIMALYKATK